MVVDFDFSDLDLSALDAWVHELDETFAFSVGFSSAVGLAFGIGLSSDDDGLRLGVAFNSDDVVRADLLDHEELMARMASFDCQHLCS